jgi:hypothetical protein
MKRTIIILAFLLGSFLNPLISSTKADNSSYIGIKLGTTYAFTYTISPAVRDASATIDLPVTIKVITELNSTASNVTYQTTYKIEQNGIPINQDITTIVTIDNTMNLFNYANRSSTPFGIFFIYNSTADHEITISASDNSKLGNGKITWDKNGVLSRADLTIIIDGTTYTITIAQKGQAAATPGYSVLLIGCTLAGTVVFVVIRLVKKEKKKIACP